MFVVVVVTVTVTSILLLLLSFVAVAVAATVPPCLIPSYGNPHHNCKIKRRRRSREAKQKEDESEIDKVLFNHSCCCYFSYHPPCFDAMYGLSCGQPCRFVPHTIVILCFVVMYGVK